MIWLNRIKLKIVTEMTVIKVINLKFLKQIYIFLFINDSNNHFKLFMLLVVIHTIL